MAERVTERIFWAVKGVDENINTVHFEVQDPMGPVTYHACIAPSCEPVSFINNIGTIDFFSLVVENEYIFVQKSTDDVTALFVSYKRGPFKKAYFPHQLHPLVRFLNYIYFSCAFYFAGQFYVDWSKARHKNNSICI